MKPPTEFKRATKDSADAPAVEL